MPISKEKTLMKKAVELVNSGHKDQLYGDKPYTYHISQVAHRAGEMWGKSEEITLVSLMHDLCEDTKYTEHDLRKEGFPESIIMAVKAISRKQGEDNEDYYLRVKKNDLAFAVKMADSLCNLQESIIGNDKVRVDRYTKQINRLMNKDITIVH